VAVQSSGPGPTASQRAAVVSRHPATLRHVAQALGVAGLTSRQAIGPSFLPRSAPGEFEVVLLDLDIEAETDPVELCRAVAAACPETPIVTFAGVSPRQRLARSLAHGLVAGIVPKLGLWTESTAAASPAEGPDEAALGVALRRRVERHANGHALGPAPYLLSGVPLFERLIGSSSDKDEVLAQILADAQRFALSDEKLRRIEVAADELMLNAIYDAPRDDDGNPLYADIDRRTPVSLGAKAQVRVRWGCDGRSFAVSVADRFGALTRARLVEHVARFVDGGSPRLARAPVAAGGGAGLGLVLTFSAANQLNIHVDAGRLTECTAVIYVAGSNRAALARGNALHLFY
jgi:hypothetical protein